jgi:hypothetical protein
MLPLAAEGSTLTRKKVLPVNDGHVEDCYRVLNLSMGNMDRGSHTCKKGSLARIRVHHFFLFGGCDFNPCSEMAGTPLVPWSYSHSS